VRLLIVEDEASMMRGLVDVLSAKGYAVESAITGDGGWAMASKGGYDLILLDVMLPGLSGFDVLRQLRAKGDRTPVILLTAKNTELDKVLGFELGVDDYVTKPFSMLELLGRIGAVLRRAQPAAAPVSEAPDLVRFGPVTVDLRRYTATSAAGVREMPAKAIAILRELIRQSGCVVSRDALIDAVWGQDEFINQRTVTNLVVKLRQAIEPDPDQPRYLKTVHGVGYRLDVDPK
jgi:DNA-binding response OmpR family regulator